MTRSLLLVLVFVGVVFSQSYPIYNCTNPNDCTYTPEGYSYCRGGICRQCDPTLTEKDCQCEASQYCVSDTTEVVFTFILFEYDNR